MDDLRIRWLKRRGWTIEEGQISGQHHYYCPRERSAPSGHKNFTLEQAVMEEINYYEFQNFLEENGEAEALN